MFLEPFVVYSLAFERKHHSGIIRISPYHIRAKRTLLQIAMVIESSCIIRLIWVLSAIKQRDNINLTIF